jgi:RNA polymerase sigma-70 factor, ECF subfamily
MWLSSGYHFAMSGMPVPTLAGEAELARRIADAAPGFDREAERELCLRFGPRIRRYGLVHLRDAEAASDLMQQVLLMILEKLRAGAVREPERLVSFIFGMCRMVVMNARRGEGRHERLLEQFAGDLEISDIAPAPRLDHDRLARCLEALAERERSVLVMTFYEDRDAEEVGRLLDVSAGNVRVIRHRALGRLRDCVAGGAP